MFLGDVAPDPGAHPVGSHVEAVVEGYMPSGQLRLSLRRQDLDRARLRAERALTELNDWARGQLKRLTELAGEQVSGWAGTEMALTDDNGPTFRDPRVPFLQLTELELRFDARHPFTIASYQDDSEFGLRGLERSLSPGPHVGIFRPLTSCDLPTGVINWVRPSIDAGVIAELLLAIGGRQVLLMAGEVSPRTDDFVFVRCDESVLVFSDAADADAISWQPPREPRD